MSKDPSIAIVASGQGWHVQDLLRAATTLGLQARAVDYRRVQAGTPPRLNPFVGDSHVLVRTMAPGSLEQIVFRMDVLQRLQARGVRVMNSPRAIESCVDKYLATELLAAQGLAVPETITCQHSDDALAAFDALGGDVVVKPLFGSEGRGIVRVQDREMAWRTFRTLERLQAVHYVQKFVPHEGYDVRAFVVGNRILAAMRRYANGDWRTNVSQGGRAEVITLTAEETALALRAAKAVDAEVCGVDLLPAQDGRTYVLEVNSVPGWRALAPVSGIPVATAVLRRLVEQEG